MQSRLVLRSRGDGCAHRSANQPTLYGMMAARTLVAAFACLAGCFSVPDFGSDDEHKNLSYDQFIAEIGTHGFDPRGASEINCRSFSTRDSYDIWYSMAIPLSNYDELIKRVADGLSEPQTRAVMATSNSIELPTKWPKPDSHHPSWWNLPKDGAVKCTRWELQSEDRARGWFWVYDRENQRLWIWEWNHQWHRFY
ncbi:MAG: hypothetical protein IH991_10335 [Planctomycetes bacterium]|nr:hypothetical protein [Planctomycetota bacterium]